MIAAGGSQCTGILLPGNGGRKITVPKTVGTSQLEKRREGLSETAGFGRSRIRRAPLPIGISDTGPMCVHEAECLELIL